MKTEMIKECIKMAGWESTEQNPNDLEPFREQARAELAELAADNAAMREALKPFADHLGSIKGTFTEDTGFRFGDKVYCRITRPLYKSDFMRAERALTPDSGKDRP